jgi:hypothetical protein
MESNQYIMFIKNSPAFYMDAIVTIFKTEERDEISSNKKIKYERPFAVGFVKLIQDDGLIQIEIMDFVEECSNDEREGLNRCDPNIIKRLSVRPFMHMKYLEVINK